MKNFNLILLSGLLFFLFSCQSDTGKKTKSEVTTFANLYVRYMQPEQNIKATAVFDLGKDESSASSLQIENGVFFHNANMKEREIKNVGYRYSYEMKGEFSNTFKFRFTEPTEGKMNYEVKMNPIENFKFEHGISISKGMTVDWDGKPLEENESLVFLIQDTKGKSATIELKGKTSDSKISTSDGKLKSLSPGSAKVYLVRKQTTSTSQSNFVAHCNTEFYTKETETVITP